MQFSIYKTNNKYTQEYNMSWNLNKELLTYVPTYTGLTLTYKVALPFTRLIGFKFYLWLEYQVDFYIINRP